MVCRENGSCPASVQSGVGAGTVKNGLAPVVVEKRSCPENVQSEKIREQVIGKRLVAEKGSCPENVQSEKCREQVIGKRNFPNWAFVQAQMVECSTYEELEEYIQSLAKMPTLQAINGNKHLNCFFNSLSRLVFGNQKHATEMRVRLVVEAVLNKAKYLDNTFLERGHTDQLEKINYVDEYIEYTCIPQQNRSEVVSASFRDFTYRQLIFDMRRLNVYTGIWQFHQAAVVLQCPVKMICVDVVPTPTYKRIRNLYNRVFLPDLPEIEVNNECIHVMFTRCGDVHQPNHFVPVVQRNTNIKVLNAQHRFIVQKSDNRRWNAITVDLTKKDHTTSRQVPWVDDEFILETSEGDSEKPITIDLTKEDTITVDNTKEETIPMFKSKAGQDDFITVVRKKKSVKRKEKEILVVKDVEHMYVPVAKKTKVAERVDIEEFDDETVTHSDVEKNAEVCGVCIRSMKMVGKGRMEKLRNAFGDDVPEKVCVGCCTKLLSNDTDALHLYTVHESVKCVSCKEHVKKMVVCAKSKYNMNDPSVVKLLSTDVSEDSKSKQFICKKCHHNLLGKETPTFECLCCKRVLIHNKVFQKCMFDFRKESVKILLKDADENIKQMICNLCCKTLSGDGNEKPFLCFPKNVCCISCHHHAYKMTIFQKDNYTNDTVLHVDTKVGDNANFICRLCDNNFSECKNTKARAQFKKKCQQFPEFVCTVCHRMLFITQVINLQMEKYDIDKRVVKECFSYPYHTKGKEYICCTCHSSLRKKEPSMPDIAVANDLEVPDQPCELKGLTVLERRCISANIPFMMIQSACQY